MSFSAILKHLRRKNDMTQDELAEALGLTPQAVSRWENGAAFPDSTTIRRLAYLFDVTTDYLLEVDSAQMADRIDRILASVDAMEPAEAVQTIRDALKEYPRNLRLMAALVSCLYYRVYCRNPEDKKAKQVLDEALATEEYLYDREDRNGKTYGDVYTLLCMYRDAGQMEKGKRLLSTLGDYSTVRQEMAIELASGEEKVRLMQENAHILLSKLSWQVYMLSLEDTIPEEKQVKMLEQMFAASRALMPDDEPYFFNAQPTHIPWQLAKHYSLRGQTDEAIRWLEIMEKAARPDDAFEGERKFRLHSPVVEGYELTRRGKSWGSAWMLDVMGDSYFDNIRSDPRFEEIRGRLVIK